MALCIIVLPLGLIVAGAAAALLIAGSGVGRGLAIQVPPPEGAYWPAADGPGGGVSLARGRHVSAEGYEREGAADVCRLGFLRTGAERGSGLGPTGSRRGPFTLSPHAHRGPWPRRGTWAGPQGRACRGGRGPGGDARSPTRACS